MNTPPPSRTSAAIALLVIVGIVATVCVLGFVGPDSTIGRVVLAVLAFLGAPFIR